MRELRLFRPDLDLLRTKRIVGGDDEEEGVPLIDAMEVYGIERLDSEATAKKQKTDVDKNRVPHAEETGCDRCFAERWMICVAGNS